MSNIHAFPKPLQSAFLETVTRLRQEAFTSQSFTEDPCAGLWLMASTIAREVTPDLRSAEKQAAIEALGHVIGKHGILRGDGAAVDGAIILVAAIAGNKPQLMCRADAPTTSRASAPAVTNYSGRCFRAPRLQASR